MVGFEGGSLFYSVCLWLLVDFGWDDVEFIVFE